MRKFPIFVFFNGIMGEIDSILHKILNFSTKWYLMHLSIWKENDICMIYIYIFAISKFFYTLFPFYPFYSEKAMAAHSSTLAWKIPWMEKPGGLQSMGSLRVRHDWKASLSLFTFMHWRRTWQPTPVFVAQGWGSLVGCCLRGRTESDMTEAT